MRTVRGFTTIELLVVMTIAGILLAVAVPNFGDLLRRHRVNTTANDLQRGLSLARGQALATGHRVAVAPTSGSAWGNGWRIFVDVDADGVYTAGTDTLMEEFPAASDGLAFTSSSFGENGRTFISFNQFGTARALNGTTLVSGQIAVTLDSERLTVCLAANGRATVVKTSNC